MSEYQNQLEHLQKIVDKFGISAVLKPEKTIVYKENEFSEKLEIDNRKSDEITEKLQKSNETKLKKIEKFISFENRLQDKFSYFWKTKKTNNFQGLFEYCKQFLTQKEQRVFEQQFLPAYMNLSLQEKLQNIGIEKSTYFYYLKKIEKKLISKVQLFRYMKSKNEKYSDIFAW